MQIYVVIYEEMHAMPYTVKLVHRIIPTTLDQFETVYKQNADLLRRDNLPYCQVHVYFRGDTSIFDEAAKLNG
jgi:hypothetical protein